MDAGRETRGTREIEHLEIPLADGCRLAARLWLPGDAEQHPCPAILEYIPYRKNDETLPRDATLHPQVAAHGYACVRVDLRGSGESDGVLPDEYLQQELDDGVEVIEWLAAQPWCDGNVGMIGISWGGFNALQIAALQPPALKAIITCCSTDDRYADDVHYMGGCLLGDNLSWAAQMFARTSYPPDPRHVGDRWRELWLQRLQHTGHWLEAWLEHQHRDDYWRHGSVCEDLGRIRCPVFAVSGWADGYCNSVFRLLAGLDVPRKGLVGPWAHQYPHMGKPGPAIDFVDECLRWWDHWLKGEDRGCMDEPMWRAWLQDSVPPAGLYQTRPGRWAAGDAWPPPDTEQRRFHPGADGGLHEARAPAADGALPLCSPLTTGLAAGKWCSYAVPGDLPVDQRGDDAGSLAFDTAPLERPLEFLGEAVVELELECDRPLAQLAVRLNDVAPDGASTRVTYGLLNLAHRDGHAEPEPLVPGERYRVRVPMKHVGQRLAAGHRLRLALSTCYWPLAWPSPEPATVTVHTAGSHLELPVLTDVGGAGADGGPEPIPPVPPARMTQLEVPDNGWSLRHDLGRGEHQLEVRDGKGRFRIDEAGLTVTRTGWERYRVVDGDWQSPCGETRWRVSLARGEWEVTTITETLLTADPEAFHLTASLRAFENGELVHQRDWQRTIPRALV
ncbi:MAG: CocE/NonD family hydrolase [Halofilum sp. (in: g-proteobacteria)]|nr:CocE/NonD family hydrolase [Halofilum sp. (in: g-proteobacteria)]